MSGIKITQDADGFVYVDEIKVAWIGASDEEVIYFQQDGICECLRRFAGRGGVFEEIMGRIHDMAPATRGALQ